MFNLDTDSVDVKLSFNNDIFDIAFDSTGDFVKTAGLDTAVLMSLTCERRADASEVKQPRFRRGWLGNELTGFGDFEYGSKNWLLEQARTTETTLNNAVTYTQAALQWLVEDGLVESVVVTGEYDNNMDLILFIQFVRNDNVIETRGFNLWRNTFVGGEI